MTINWGELIIGMLALILVGSFTGRRGQRKEARRERERQDQVRQDIGHPGSSSFVAPYALDPDEALRIIRPKKRQGFAHPWESPDEFAKGAHPMETDEGHDRGAVPVGAGMMMGDDDDSIEIAGIVEPHAVSESLGKPILDQDDTIPPVDDSPLPADPAS